MKGRSRYAVAIAAAGIGLLAAVPAAAQARSTIVISGSTSVAPLVTKWARAYSKTRAGKSVTFRIAQGGSDIGVGDAAKGRVTFGLSSRDEKPADPGGLSWKRIAKDALCVVTNKQNSVRNLTQNQIRAVFGGDVRSWGGVPGSTVNGTIDVNVRTAASGTQDAFDKLFMTNDSGKKKIFSGANKRASSGLVAQAVKSDTKAIGYVSHAFTAGLNDVAYNGVPCTRRNAQAGTYRGTRSFWAVAKGGFSPAAAKFLNWTQGSAGDKITNSEWVALG